MKKSIIALAVTSAMATAAFAQSSVSIYGIADVGFAHSSSDRKDNVDTKNSVASGMWDQSRIGFTGTEAVGNGLTAGFTFEYGLDTNTGAGINTAREQSVNLTSKTFGTVKAGYMETLGSVELTKFDAMRATGFSTLSALTSTTLTEKSRAGNTVAYISPVIAGGLTFGATYSTDITLAPTAYGSGTNQERVYGLMADYTAGPFSIGYAYHDVSDLGRVSGLNNKEHMFGAKYAVTKDLTILGSYQTDESSNNITDRNIWSIGGQVAVLPNVTIDGAYSRLNDKTAANADATAWGVQASYAMSKRTSLYGGYTHVDNDNGATYVALGSQGVTPSGIGGLTSSGYGFGMRHSF